MGPLTGRRALAAALVVAALAAALPFVPTLDGEFIYDDRFQIVENDQLRDLGNLPRFFTEDVWAAVGLPYSSYYRPLMYTTFAFEFAIAGPDPWIYRVTNLLLHVGATLLVLVLLVRTGESLPAATLGAVLFGLHPMHAEVVAWPSARPELLVTFFALAAAVVHARSPVGAGPGFGRFLAVGGLVMLALFSKETGVLAPVLIGLATLLRADASTAIGRIRQGVSAALPFLALIAVFMGVRALSIQVESLPPIVGQDTAGRLIATWPEAIARLVAINGHYLQNLLLPLDASSFRVPSWDHVKGGLLFAPLGLLAIAAAPWSRSAAWLAFACLAVALQSLGIPSAGYLSQRYAYLPSVGSCAAVASALAWAVRGGAPASRRFVMAACAVALAALYATLLVPRAEEWSRESLLWEVSYERDPDSPAALANYGYMLVDRGEAERALALFERLESVEPGGWAAPYGRGNALAALGRKRESIPHYEEAIRRSPKIPQLRQSLGFVYEDLGEFEEAKRVFQEALELFPDSSVGLGVLGVLSAKSGSPEKALADIEAALALRPDQAALRINRVVLLAQIGRVDDAIAASEELVRDPLLATEGERSLGILYDRYRPDPARAIAHYEQSLRLAPHRRDATQLKRRIAALKREAAARGGGDATTPPPGAAPGP